MKITYKGETLDTIHYREMSDSKFNELKKEYYQKPDFELVKKQFRQLSKGGTQNNIITNYYVKDLMAQTKIYYNKWSIADCFECKDLLCFFYDKIFSNDKVYPRSKSDIINIETAFRLGGKGIASKPANFPIKVVDYILEKYNTNNNYYDFSCGWGARLTSALKNKVNYYGTDPNYLLTERLKQLASDYKDTIGVDNAIDIRTQGSEIFNPDWENKMGLCFSSPPYFYLEDYKIGNQSYKPGMSYQEWLDNWLEPTMRNIYMYLIDYGYFILNINDFKEFHLVSDSMKIAYKCGFKLIKIEKLNNIKRCKSSGGVTDNSENILVFIKDLDNLSHNTNDWSDLE